MLTLKEMYPLSSTRVKLENLVLEEKKDLEGQGEATGIVDGNNLLADYKESEPFRKAYREAISLLCLPRTEPELKDFSQRFAGRVFHDLAQIFVRAKLPSSSVLLSPERTLRFYKQLYPGAQRTKHSFSLDSLRGISVPDGLIIEEKDGQVQIAAICEYTLFRDEEKMRTKDSGIRMERNRFPRFFAKDAYLLFVVPREEILRPRRNFGSSQFQEAPFTYRQFGDFMDSLCYSYQLEDDSATLAEIQKEARIQLERGKEYERGGFLTPEYQQYLRRAADSSSISL